MKLYMIRHGESETNKIGCYTGWAQVSLTEKGFFDAKKVTPILEGIAFDKIYSSDLIRAIQTLETALPGAEYETTPLIREINVGELERQPGYLLTDEMRELVSHRGFVDYKGENREEFNGRVKEFMKMLENSGYDNVAAFSHAGVLRRILDEVVGMVLPRSKIKCSNCTVAVFEFAKDNWSLESWINI